MVIPDRADPDRVEPEQFTPWEPGRFVKYKKCLATLTLTAACIFVVIVILVCS